MQTTTKSSLEKRIRVLIVFFMSALVVSGLTAFPLEWEIGLLRGHEGIFPEIIREWFLKVGEGLIQTNSRFPFLVYGTDWLAFSHIIIALFFIAPLKEPSKYLLIIEIGIIACLLVFPLALICGHIRGIPFFWQLIDCSFGVGGAALLLYIRKSIHRLSQFNSNSSQL